MRVAARGLSPHAVPRAWSPSSAPTGHTLVWPNPLARLCAVRGSLPTRQFPRPFIPWTVQGNAETRRPPFAVAPPPQPPLAPRRAPPSPPLSLYSPHGVFSNPSMSAGETTSPSPPLNSCSFAPMPRVTASTAETSVACAGGTSRAAATQAASRAADLVRLRRMARGVVRRGADDARTEKKSERRDAASRLRLTLSFPSWRDARRLAARSLYPFSRTSC